MFNRPLHGLRGLASIMVFYAHVTFGFYDKFYPDDAVLSAVMPKIANLGTYGVELFFVISGYVIAQSCLKYSAREFALRRFMRIYPLFASFTLFYFVANSFLHLAPGRGNTADLFFNLVFLDLFAGHEGLTPNAWSITLEVWYYACTYLLFHAFLKRHTLSAAWVVPAVALALLVLTAFDISAYFVGGVVLEYLSRKAQVAVRILPTPGFAAALAILLVIATWFDFEPRNYFSVPGKQLLAVVLLVSTLLVVNQVLHGAGWPARILSCRAFAFLGTISYSLYLVHPYAYMLLRLAGQRIGIAARPWQETLPVYLVAVTVLALGVAWLVNRLVEQGAYRLAFRGPVYQAKVS